MVSDGQHEQEQEKKRHRRLAHEQEIAPAKVEMMIGGAFHLFLRHENPSQQGAVISGLGETGNDETLA